MTATVTYESNLRTTCLHLQSGSAIETDAPTDNKGKGERESIKNLLLSDEDRNKNVYEKIIKIKEKDMNKAVKELDFKTAAILRDEIVVLKGKMDKIILENKK